MSEQKRVLVLGRRDHTEAMRVAAGLTIFGHQVRLVFMTGPVAETPENMEQAETLELCEIEPETTVPDQELPQMGPHALSLALIESDTVISL